MRRTAIAAAVGLALASAGLRAQEDCSGLRADVSRLEAQVSDKDSIVREMRDEAQATSREVAELRGRLEGLVAGPFLASPPPGSDTAGVAQHAVFAPRLEVDLAQRHDLVSFVLRRVEMRSAPTVASFDLVADQESVPVPVDLNGALYVIDWVTSEGYTLTLVLRDGATGNAAATTQVRPQQRSGRFIFVGYAVGGCCIAD
jgi:hypothetical protein